MTQSSPCSRSVVTFALASILAVSVSSAGAAQSHPDPELVLRPGDALRITVWRMPELTAEEVEIVDDGSLDHPFYRTVQVAGMGLADVKLKLAERLRQVQANPEFVVQPLVRITVFGEVRQPNVFRHPPQTSIADAIALAGGVSDRGNEKHVRLIRGGSIIALNLRDVLGPATRMRIRSGDEIIVGRRGSSFRELFLPMVSMVAAAASLANLIRR